MRHLLAFVVAAVALMCGATDECYRKYNLTPETVRKNVDDAWDWLMGTWYWKTGLIYGGDVFDVERANAFTNGVIHWHKGMKHGYGAYISDCALNMGVILPMLCDKYSVTKDSRIKDEAKKVVFGLLNLSRRHGRKGYVARGLCAEDGKGICTVSSRDQLTHWIHGLWVYCKQPWADEKTKEEIKTAVRDVAELMKRTMVKETGYNYIPAEWSGDERSFLCRMWGDGVKAHEVTRLPMVYIVAWDITGDGKWKTEYEKYIDESLDRTLQLRNKPMSAFYGIMPCYAFLQVNTSLEPVWLLEKNDERRAKVREAMEYIAKMAEERVQNRRGLGGMSPAAECLLTLMITPGRKLTKAECEFLLFNVKKWIPEENSFDAVIHTWDITQEACDAAHRTAAYWKACATGSL